MASTSKCPYCGAAVRSDQTACPNCGAPNERYVVDTPRTVFRPKTIEELQEYCAERGMPLLRMRFFIGEDFKEPRAFGIYRDGKNVVVYKNKANGARAVRYCGPDEARGVRELYQKLLEECHMRGIYPDGKPVPLTPKSRRAWKKKRNLFVRLRRNRFGRAFLIFLACVLAGFVIQTFEHRDDGYYRVSDDSPLYYRYGTDWYYSYGGDDNDWLLSDDAPTEYYAEYGLGEDWNADWGAGDFKDSDAWESIQASSSSGGSGSSADGYSLWDDDNDDWDWDLWDSNDTDWDSDW